MAKGYTTLAAVNAYLQRTLTPDQVEAMDFILEGVETFVDQKTGQTWGVSPIVGDVYVAANEPVTLRSSPVTTIQEVRAYDNLGTTPQVLVPNVDYRLIDPARGLLWVHGSFVVGYDYFQVDYTPSAVVPADVKLAATMIVAQFMAPALNNGAVGIKSYSIDGESVTFQDSSIPKAAVDILEDLVGRNRGGGRFVFV